MLSPPFDPESSPLRSRVAWVLSTAQTRAFTVDEIKEVFSYPPLMPLPRVEYLQGPWSLSMIEAYDELSDTFARITLRFADGHRETLRICVSPTPPHRIRYISRYLAPEGVTVREATEADGPMIADLERRTPVVDDGVARSYGRADWFAQLRLMGGAKVVVAEIDGRIVAVHVASLRTAHYDGRPLVMFYMCRTRIDPMLQGRGVFQAVNGGLVDTFMPFVTEGWGFDSEENYIAAKNERVREMTRSQKVDLDWSTAVLRLSLDTAAMAAADGPGRPAGSQDLNRIADLLNATHGRSAGFGRLDPGAVSQRFLRAPQSYGLPNVLVGERAIVGAWDEQTVVTYASADQVREERSATVLDYGCEPDATDELIALLRQHCARLADAGITRLSLYTSEASPLSTELQSIAKTTETFLYRSRLPEPGAARAEGIYVDPIYF